MSDTPHGVIKASFLCDICEDIAAVVYYIPEGVTHPLARSLSENSDRLVIEGFLGHVALVIFNKTDRVRRAVQSQDAKTLYEIDPFLAPFFCPTCTKPYCRTHWTTQVVFADDFPGWYEHTSGLCPDGHTRLLDD